MLSCYVFCKIYHCPQQIQGKSCFYNIIVFNYHILPFRFLLNSFTPQCTIKFEIQAVRGFEQHFLFFAENSQPKPENLVLKKKSGSQKVQSRKSLSRGLKKFGLKKVSVLVSKKGLSIGLKNIWSKKKSWYRSR